MSRPLSAILASGELDGYRAGVPPLAPGWADASATDARICARSRCAACGHRGLDYRPFTREGSYRAFMACPSCGAAQEFYRPSEKELDKRLS